MGSACENAYRGNARWNQCNAALPWCTITIIVAAIINTVVTVAVKVVLPLIGIELPVVGATKFGGPMLGSIG